MNKDLFLQNDMEEAEPSSKSQISARALLTCYRRDARKHKSQIIKAQALKLGFFACGIAKAGPVDEDTASHYRQWLVSGGHADMHYLENNLDKRLDPTLLLEGARSIIVVALNYAPTRRLQEEEYQIAAYAYGKDYHDVLKHRLIQLTQHLLPSTLHPSPVTIHPSPVTHKICTDTVPILERYWAQQAGIGFIGRNHQLIIPHAGSMFFLGEIITTAEFDTYDTPMENRCGTCHRCVEACPTGALQMEDGRWKMEDSCAQPIFNFQFSIFNSKKCLSYQTIENRGSIDESLKDKLGNSIYGCDRCQQVCPWNRFATPTDIPELQPSDTLLNMTREKWQHLSVEEYRELFRGSAVKRAKYEGLMRNIKAVAESEVRSEE